VAISSPSTPPVGVPCLTNAALDYITAALRACGSQSVGEPVSADDAQTGLCILNQMIDMWNSMQLMIFTIQRLVFPLVVGQQVYTVGVGGNFNIPRPPRIEKYSIITNANPLLPLELPIEDLTLEDWREIPVKNITAGLCLGVWNDKGFPLMSLSYWPIPSQSLNAVIYPWIQLSTFPDLVTQFTFPPAYAECIKYNLAYRMGIEFPGDMERMPLLKDMADKAMDQIKSFNTDPADLSACELDAISTNRGYYNFYADVAAPFGRRRWR
jgi:hypothetical protein